MMALLSKALCQSCFICLQQFYILKWVIKVQAGLVLVSLCQIRTRRPPPAPFGLKALSLCFARLRRGDRSQIFGSASLRSQVSQNVDKWLSFSSYGMKIIPLLTSVSEEDFTSLVAFFGGENIHSRVATIIWWIHSWSLIKWINNYFDHR